jgi:NADPH:quinone reductase-like Zn-dependent oxidoreductase/acyl carrier protein
VPPALSDSDGVTTDHPYRLEPSKQGVLKDLRLVPSTRQKPGPGQVEIEIRASSLNFRDVLNAMNLYPGDAGPLGLECAGRISAVGQGTSFKVGDKVLGLAWECFSKYALTHAELIVPLPAHMTYADGATIPITFLTASAALRELARITPRDKVLIHAGAGGVGQAAIQIAQQVGAEIFATAGSPVKRTYLREMGVHHVFDSRSFEFVEEIKKLTDGKGVDVVLNSLAGEYVPRSLSILGNGGRFVEIGKIDIWDEAKLAEVRPDVDYHIFALDDLLVREPETISEMLTNLMPEFTSAGLQPLRQTCFDVANASKAFEFMAKAGHIGKIVLNHPRSEAQVDAPAEARVHKDATYLITGGLGGLGLVIARWLVQQGGQHIVLVGRSAPSEEALQLIETLQTAEARIYIKLDDVTDRQAVERLIGQIEAEMPPLKGVFHAAGVIDDGILARQQWKRFMTVMAPKVAGATYLHEYTRDKALDHFVLFSSIASLLGSPGQSNYAAGNAFLDALAHHRHAAGLPALCINWGPWHKLGMTARLDDAIGRHWAGMGIGSVALPLGLTAMELLMEQHPPQVGVMGIDWAQLMQRFPPDLRPPAIEELVEDLREHLEPSREWLEFVEKLRAALPKSRKDMMTRFLQDKAAEVLELESHQQIDPDAPLNELGFDSLMAVELANRIGAAAGIAINPTLLFDYPTLAAIAGYFVDEALDLEGEDGVRRKTLQTDEARESIAELVDAAMRDRPQPEAPATDMMSETTEAILSAIESMTDQEVDRLVQGPSAVKEE